MRILQAMLRQHGCVAALKEWVLGGGLELAREALLAAGYHQES